MSLATINNIFSIKSLLLFVLISNLFACTQLKKFPSRSTVESTSNKPTKFGSSPKKKTPSYRQFSDIPFPSGASINADKTTVVGSTPWFGQLVLESASRPDLLFDFYDTKVESYRWQKIASVRSETSILTFLKGSRVLSISIKEKHLRGSNVLITASPLSNAQTAPQSQNNASDLMPVPVQKIK